MLLWSVDSSQRLKEMNSLEGVEIKQSMSLNVPAFTELEIDWMPPEVIERTI